MAFQSRSTVRAFALRRNDFNLAKSCSIGLSQMWCTTFELNPQENIWEEIRGKIFKNHAAKSMDEVCEMQVLFEPELV